MSEMNLLQAVNNALDFEMEQDDDVLVFGEDVGGAGGVFRTTAGLQEKFGEKRCFDTPLSEAGIIGAAIGMAVYGLRPVAEIQFLDFIYPAFDQIINEAAKMRYRSGGQFTCPMVIRTPYGGGIRGGHYHSQSGETYFAHTPGLKVVVPSNPADTKGLLLASIRDPDPVLFFEPKRMYRSSKGEVPEGEHVVPLGKAAITRPGEHVTVVTFGAMVEVALKAAKKAAAQGVDVEVVDLRTLVPLDWETVAASVIKTGRLVTLYEAPKTCGFGAEISALVAEKLILHLEAPILRVTGYDTPFPYSLENLYLPTPERVLDAVLEVANY
ncbi:MAG: alpha-ketoacid dehydrogenase subunit beta [Planctomycetota bacterium]|jgi:2-oxoisovalerate dehydrogenase E1 component beta subunit|nr:alpha-ketoacid dehydrogenase subunit beta [Planctomycetota bacterium]